MDIAPDQNTRQSERIRPFDRPPSLLSVTLFHVDAGDTKHGGLNYDRSEHTYMDMATTSRDSHTSAKVNFFLLHI